MTAVKIAALVVAAAVLCVAIRVNRPELAMAVGLIAGLTACLLSMDELAGAVRVLKEWLAKRSLFQDFPQKKKRLPEAS